MSNSVDHILGRARSRSPVPLPGGFADHVISVARERAQRTPMIVTGVGISMTAIASVASAAMIAAFFQGSSEAQPPAVFSTELPIVSR